MVKRSVILGLILLISLSIVTPGYCDDAMKKLGRGVCNMITCPLEIIKQSSDTANSDGPWAGFTWGIIKGVGMTVTRFAVGAFETVTFPFPVPPEYKPILTDPEFFWEEYNW